MASQQARNTPRVRDRISGALFGPIGPFVGQSGSGEPATHLYMFSEIVMCEWFSLQEGDHWLAQDLVIPVHEKRGPFFTAGSIRQVQLAAWPCSVYHNTEEAGWAVDEWQARVVSHAKGEAIEVKLRVAIAGIGTRLNRVGYQWMVYSIDPSVRY